MTSRHLLVVAVGFTHASSVIAEVNCSDAEFGTLTRALVPLKESAPPYLPDVDHVVLDVVPLLPVPEASPTVVPLPSLNEYAATRPVVAAPVEPTANNGSISSAAASAKADRDRLAEHADLPIRRTTTDDHPHPRDSNADSGSSDASTPDFVSWSID